MRSLFRTFIGLVGVLSQLGLLLVVVVDVLPFGPRGVAARRLWETCGWPCARNNVVDFALRLKRLGGYDDDV